MSIGSRVKRLRDVLALQKVSLVLVSKGQSTDKIMDAYQHGQRSFGENRVQELCRKYESLPKDIQWHMIGHLQRNKVKYIVPFVHCVHSVDSTKLLHSLNREAEKVNRLLPCLMQVRLSQDPLKHGFSVEALTDFFERTTDASYPNMAVMGLMGMASYTQNMAVVAEEYALLHQLFLAFKKNYCRHPLLRHELSMGMSRDYKIALQHGGTTVRIGSLLFT